jgi:hypothetical protein
LPRLGVRVWGWLAGWLAGWLVGQAVDGFGADGWVVRVGRRESEIGAVDGLWKGGGSWRQEVGGGRRRSGVGGLLDGGSGAL